MVSLRLIGAIVALPTMIGVWVVTFDRYWRVSGKMVLLDCNFESKSYPKRKRFEKYVL